MSIKLIPVRHTALREFTPGGVASGVAAPESLWQNQRAIRHTCVSSQEIA
jgi:hypothetical protein